MIAITWELILGSALIVVFFGLVGEGVARLIRRFGKRAGIKDSALAVVRDLIRAIWVILAVVAVAFFTNLASDLTLIAVSTVGGLIVSLALQATLSNVIAGLFMLEDGTLRVGDEITYSGTHGKVIRMTLRSSWIMTDKGTIVVVSNSNLMGGPLAIQSATPRLLRRHGLESTLPSASATDTPGEKSTRKGPETEVQSSSDEGRGPPSGEPLKNLPARDAEAEGS